MDLLWISHPIWGLIRLSTLGGRWSIFMARLAPPHLVTIIHKRTGQIRDQAEGRYVLLEVFFNVRAWGWHVLRTPKDPTRTMWWCTDVYKNYIQIYASFPDASLMSERCEPGGFSVHGCCPGRNAQSIPSLIGINHNSQQLSDCWRLGPLDSYMADVPLDQQEHLRWVTGSTSLEHFQYWTCVARPSRSTMLWLRSERRFTCHQ